mgnify:CR=1 FL=1
MVGKMDDKSRMNDDPNECYLSEEKLFPVVFCEIEEFRDGDCDSFEQVLPNDEVDMGSTPDKRV